jgi:NADPH:quinone reductase-like Zn-dependent oxidoreductase
VIAVEVSSFGESDVLRLVERAEPTPGAGEVAIRVERCALNASDLLQRAGLYPGGHLLGAANEPVECSAVPMMMGCLPSEE